MTQTGDSALKLSQRRLQRDQDNTLAANGQNPFGAVTSNGVNSLVSAY